jgi:uncharacterized protein YjeT (DUF2065 family)
MDYFVTALGLAFIIEGLPYFAFPERMKVFIQRISEVPESYLRTFGFLAALLGLVLAYVGRTVM